MKKLYFIRHAKSDWNNTALKDFDRPLNARGNRDVEFMANKFASKDQSVDLIISSPAMRALTTANKFVRALGLPISAVEQNHTIYEASLKELLRIINELDDSVESVVLFGHNPGFSELSSYLTGRHIEMPTCSIVELNPVLDDWKQLSSNTCILADFDYPKRDI